MMKSESAFDERAREDARRKPDSWVYWRMSAVPSRWKRRPGPTPTRVDERMPCFLAGSRTAAGNDSDDLCLRINESNSLHEESPLESMWQSRVQNVRPPRPRIVGDLVRNSRDEH